MSHADSNRRWREKNPELAREYREKWRAAHPESRDSERDLIIYNRAKKVIAKLDELGTCDMAEILFA